MKTINETVIRNLINYSAEDQAIWFRDTDNCSFLSFVRCYRDQELISSWTLSQANRRGKKEHWFVFESFSHACQIHLSEQKSKLREYWWSVNAHKPAGWVQPHCITIPLCSPTSTPTSVYPHVHLCQQHHFRCSHLTV